MTTFQRYIGHLKTISKHKWYVMLACFRCGLIWQGFMHDWSKYSPVEFFRGVKFFQGTSTPIGAEKNAIGYSFAWQHHKGRNKHHWEYWIDFRNGDLLIIRMPPKYLAEMICDIVSASRVYNNGFSIGALRKWYDGERIRMYLHPDTESYVKMMMEQVESEEELFKWISVERIRWHYINSDFPAPLRIKIKREE